MEQSKKNKRNITLNEDYAARAASVTDRRGEQEKAADAKLRFLEELFDEADTDRSGVLDVDELGALLHSYYAKSEGSAVSKKRIAREVATAMAKFASDNNGVLLFGEFVAMIFGSPDDFKMKTEPGLREIVCRKANEIHTQETGVFAERVRQWKQAQSEQRAADALYDKLSSLFAEQDADGSGSLDEPELLAMLTQYYRSEGLSKSKKKMERVLVELLALYDRDGSGSLELMELCMLFCDAPELTGGHRTPPP